MKKTIIAIVIVLLLVIGLSGSIYTVREDQYACTFRFSEIVNTTAQPGLHFKVPFMDSVKYLTVSRKGTLKCRPGVSVVFTISEKRKVHAYWSSRTV